MQWFPTHRAPNQQFKINTHPDRTISIHAITGEGFAIQVGKATRKYVGGYRVISNGQDVMLGPWEGKPHQTLHVVEQDGKYVRLQFNTPERQNFGWAFLEPVQ